MLTRRLTETSAALDRVRMESSVEIERVSVRYMASTRSDSAWGFPLTGFIVFRIF